MREGSQKHNIYFSHNKCIPECEKWICSCCNCLKQSTVLSSQAKVHHILWLSAVKLPLSPATWCTPISSTLLSIFPCLLFFLNQFQITIQIITQYHCRCKTTLTTEAHGGKLVAGAVSVDYHHAGAVVPLQLETSWTADQVHVACVVDLKAILLESRLGIPRVDVELKQQRVIR